MQQNYVWYASYGSNVNQERFLCYIKGGKPAGSDTVEIGCRDKQLPKDSQPVSIPFPLYFSGYSKKWGGAPAFIGHEQDEGHHTLGRMYLVAEEQFIDVVRQENRKPQLFINLDKVIQQQSVTIDQNSSYGRIVYLGENGDYPIFTFTSNQDISECVASKPSASYLSTIVKGIKQAYQLDYQTIARYFQNKPGIKDNWSIDQLNKLIYKEIIC